MPTLLPSQPPGLPQLTCRSPVGVITSKLDRANQGGTPDVRAGQGRPWKPNTRNLTGNTRDPRRASSSAGVRSRPASFRTRTSAPRTGAGTRPARSPQVAGSAVLRVRAAQHRRLNLPPVTLGLRFRLPQFDLTWVPASLRSLWHHEIQVFESHMNLTAWHPYRSNPWSWLVLGGPILYYRESPEYGREGCRAAGGCVRDVLGLGTPLLWWAACFALLYLLYRWGLRRDWRAGAVLCAVAAGYLPWFLYQERTTDAVTMRESPLFAAGL